MDAVFQQHYQAAERAYGLGDYTEAHALTTELWNQLQSGSGEHDPSLVMGWRAVVSLLLGHIQLHGLHNPEEAASAYQWVLESEPDATLAALAEQGLGYCRSQSITSAATTPPTHDVAIPDLLKDPFLTMDPDQAKRAQADVATAMPWLALDEEPQAVPTATPTPTATPRPVPSPEPTVSPEVGAAVDLSPPEPEQPPTEQPPTEQPSKEDDDPTPRDTAAKDLLETSWLRVQLKPESNGPTNAKESMGLFSRIKRAFARTAGS